MPYIDLQYLADAYGEEELIELTDRADPPTGQVDEAAVDRAIERAASLADSYIGRRYTLPLAETPAALASAVADIARHHLYADHPTERVKDAHEAAIAFLKDIAAGRAELQVAAGAEPEAARDQVLVAAPERIFTPDTMDGF